MLSPGGDCGFLERSSSRRLLSEFVAAIVPLRRVSESRMRAKQGVELIL